MRKPTYITLLKGAAFFLLGFALIALVTLPARVTRAQGSQGDPDLYGDCYDEFHDEWRLRPPEDRGPENLRRNQCHGPGTKGKQKQHARPVLGKEGCGKQGVHG